MSGGGRDGGGPEERGEEPEGAGRHCEHLTLALVFALLRSESPAAHLDSAHADVSQLGGSRWTRLGLERRDMEMNVNIRWYIHFVAWTLLGIQ